MTPRLCLFILAASYAGMETAYFGWNFRPASDFEVIADGISALLFAIAIAKVQP